MIPSLTYTFHEHEPVQFTPWVDRTTLSWRQRSCQNSSASPATDPMDLSVVVAGPARDEELGLPQELLDGFTTSKQRCQQVLVGVRHTTTSIPAAPRAERVFRRRPWCLLTLLVSTTAAREPQPGPIEPGGQSFHPGRAPRGCRRPPAQCGAWLPSHHVMVGPSLELRHEQQHEYSNRQDMDKRVPGRGAGGLAT